MLWNLILVTISFKKIISLKDTVLQTQPDIHRKPLYLKTLHWLQIGHHSVFKTAASYVTIQNILGLFLKSVYKIKRDGEFLEMPQFITPAHYSEINSVLPMMLSSYRMIPQ